MNPLATTRKLGALLAALSLLTLAATGAHAQSSNVFYGTVDVSWIRSSTDSGSRRTAIESGAHDASVMGWRMEEAVTPGLKAIARMEYSLAADQNAGIGAVQFGGRAISRQGYVGLSGDFGAVSAGRMSSPIKILQFFDPVGGNVFSGLLALLPTPINSRADPTHFSNAVRYTTPVMNGWQSYAVYALAPYVGDDLAYDNNQERAAIVATHYQGAQAAFFASTQLTRHLGNVSPLTLRDSSLAASWDFGRFLLAGIYVHSERSGGASVGGANSRIFDQGNLGLLYRWSEANHIGIQVSRLHEHDRAQAGATSLGLIAEHALSKRTLLYAGYNLTHNDDNTSFSADSYNRPALGDSAQLFGTGMRHSF